jgi:hypothetical protein
MPTLRISSGIGIPSSACLSTAMICSTENRLCLTTPPRPLLTGPVCRNTSAQFRSESANADHRQSTAAGVGEFTCRSAGEFGRRSGPTFSWGAPDLLGCAQRGERRESFKAGVQRRNLAEANRCSILAWIKFRLGALKSCDSWPCSIRAAASPCHCDRRAARRSRAAASRISRVLE